MENKKVLLGMSGGVDSSVTATILKENKYEVIGATLELFSNSNCDIKKDAKNICDYLSIPHIIIDGKKEFQENVINNFIEEYSNQRTPNPCIQCNKYIKFNLIYEKAKELNCDYISTGHYAKIEYSEKYKRHILKKANNIQKDQSYVLYKIPKELLQKIILPLGTFESKEQVRNLAREKKLDVANKPDSEDICFIPDGNYKEFLEKNSNLISKKGDIVDKNGKILGKHNGLYNYTIGQRKGLGIAHKFPLFVIGFNDNKNEVIVGDESELYKQEMLVNQINLLLIDELNEKIDVKVKTRYSSKEVDASIEMIDKDLIKVIFKEKVPRITPGQSAVFYINDIVLGGGKILK